MIEREERHRQRQVQVTPITPRSVEELAALFRERSSSRRRKPDQS